MSSEVLDLNLEDVQTSMDLQILLWEQLRFPGYYGCNWDAFWDCVRDPEQSRLPDVLRIRGWNPMNRRFHLRHDARMLRELRRGSNGCAPSATPRPVRTPDARCHLETSARSRA
jgi:ribonuclease inhibitor